MSSPPAPPLPRHLEMAKAVRLMMIEHPVGVTAEMVLAQFLSVLEVETARTIAKVVDAIAARERDKGVGTMLLRDKGERSDEDVARYETRYNLAKDIAEHIRGWPPDRPRQGTEPAGPEVPGSAS
jgi:hypothetical protein